MEKKKPTDEEYRKILDGVMEQAEKDFGEDINVRSKDDTEINVGMTDEEIVKAIDKCFAIPMKCEDGCPYFNKDGRNFCVENNAFYKDLKRIVTEHAEQKSEIERLKERNYWLESHHEYECEKSYFEGIEKGREKSIPDDDILEDYAHRMFDSWNDVTGALHKGCSWYGEALSVIDDIVGMVYGITKRQTEKKATEKILQIFRDIGNRLVDSNLQKGWFEVIGIACDEIKKHGVEVE